MKIALLTEGDAEYASLPKLLPQLNAAVRHTIVKPLKVNCPPDATAGIIARECKSRVLIAAAKSADLVVVLLDREEQEACPGRIASEVERAIGRMCPNIEIRVVLKDPYYESWLVADMDALAAQPQRFAVTTARRRRVEPNKADRANGMALIKEMVKGDHYDKAPDSERICSKMELERAILHSRSLRYSCTSLDGLRAKPAARALLRRRRRRQGRKAEGQEVDRATEDNQATDTLRTDLPRVGMPTPNRPVSRSAVLSARNAGA